MPPDATAPSIEVLRRNVAIGCQILQLEEQGDLIWGHVSARDPRGRGVWMKAASFGFDEITAEHVILVSWEGEVLEGQYKRHIEFPIHTELMLAREDVNCVVHTHGPWSVAFASTGEPLRPLSHDPVLFVPPDIARFTKTGDLIRTESLGKDLTADVGSRNAALMVNHGLVSCGADVQTGVLTAVLLERACRTNMRALAAGGPKTWSSDEEALSKRANIYGPDHLASAWDYLSRQVAKS